jgi:hypothetical protein
MLLPHGPYDAVKEQWKAQGGERLFRIKKPDEPEETPLVRFAESGPVLLHCPRCNAEVWLG